VIGRQHLHRVHRPGAYTTAPGALRLDASARQDYSAFMEPAQKANDVLAALPLPAWIVRHEVREVVDHTDQPALRITLYVPNGRRPQLG
jgi:hypothetical protein